MPPPLPPLPLSLPMSSRQPTQPMMRSSWGPDEGMFSHTGTHKFTRTLLSRSVVHGSNQLMSLAFSNDPSRSSGQHNKHVHINHYLHHQLLNMLQNTTCSVSQPPPRQRTSQQHRTIAAIIADRAIISDQYYRDWLGRTTALLEAVQEAAPRLPMRQYNI